MVYVRAMRAAGDDPEKVRQVILDAAHQLTSLAERIGSAARTAAQSPQDDRNALAVAQALIAGRRAAMAHFGRALFHDPAWDILLNVYLAYACGGVTSQNEIVDETGLAPTTVLTWLRRLERERLIERRRVSHDARRLEVGLSPDGLSRMRDVLGAIALQPAG